MFHEALGTRLGMVMFRGGWVHVFRQALAREIPEGNIGALRGAGVVGEKRKKD